MSVLDVYAKRYAAKLAHEYARVTKRALVAVHAEVTHAVELLLQSMQSGPFPPAFVAQILALASAPKQVTVASVETRVGTLLQLVDEAQGILAQQVTQLTAQVDRYDATIQSLMQTCTTNDSLSAQVVAAVTPFMQGVHERYPSLMGRLVEARFDQSEFTRLLTDELLDQNALHQVLREVLEAVGAQQAQRWQEAASSLQLTLHSEPQQPSIDMSALLQAYLEPIQLVYERPNMLRSIAQVLSRGRLNDKLTQEVNAALDALQTHVIAVIEHLYTETEQGWHNITQQAATRWLSEQAGMERADVAARFALWEQHKQALHQRKQQLAQITVEHVLRSWRPALTQQALTRVVERIAAENKR